MNRIELANRIAALDWSATSLQHQLAVCAAVETLRENAVNITDEHADHIVARRLEERDVIPFPPIQTGARCPNVVRFPKTRWTMLYELDGRPWASSAHFGPDGAWGWVVETVARECEVNEDQVGSIERSCEDNDPYGNDDLVTIDGLPAYRLRHEWK